MLRTLFRSDWHVYSKRPFGGAEHALRYLGHYTHRVAISNHRLVSLTNNQVTFRWRDSTHHNEHKLMILSLDEFLRRFLLHTLPRGFVRIRHFGFIAGPRRSHMLQLARRLLQTGTEQSAPVSPPAQGIFPCPVCASRMILVERLSAT